MSLLYNCADKSVGLRPSVHFLQHPTSAMMDSSSFSTAVPRQRGGEEEDPQLTAGRIDFKVSSLISARLKIVYWDDGSLRKVCGEADRASSKNTELKQLPVTWLIQRLHIHPGSFPTDSNALLSTHLTKSPENHHQLHCCAKTAGNTSVSYVFELGDDPSVR